MSPYDLLFSVIPAAFAGVLGKELHAIYWNLKQAYPLDWMSTKWEHHQEKGSEKNEYPQLHRYRFPQILNDLAL